MKYALFLLPFLLTGCASSHKPPLVDGSKRVPINSVPTDENLALRAELANSAAVLNGHKSPLTTSEQNVILKAKLSQNETALRDKNLMSYTVVFVPKGFFDIKPTEGQLEQLRRNSQKGGTITIVSDSARFLVRTKERLKELGAQDQSVQTVTEADMKDFVKIIFE